LSAASSEKLSLGLQGLNTIDENEACGPRICVSGIFSRGAQERFAPQRLAWHLAERLA